MKNTLFKKLFVYNMITVLISMVLTSVLLYAQLGAYFKVAVYDSLNPKAVQIARMSGYVLEVANKTDNRILIKELMSIVGNEEGQGYIVIDKYGEVLLHSGFEHNININRVNIGDISRTLNGESVAGDSNLNGVLPRKLLHVMVPVYTNTGIEGVVVLCNTVPYSRHMQAGVMRLFIMIMLTVVMISLIVSAFFSTRISKPIKEMTLVARRIASGDFTQRVSTDAEGELAILASSFNQMSVALKEMDEVQSSFISDVSHELRTPMTIITGFVEGVLDETIPPEEHKKYLEVVLSETKRLNRLVNDLLEMSRLNSGKIEFKMVPFDITGSLRKAIIAFEQAISEKKIDVEVDFEEDSMMVVGNSDSVYRVISNLLDNAVKFTPEGGKITINCSKSGLKSLVSIENTGKGLSEKELSHIWDRFYQTDKARTSQDRKGVGLGLYIVKNIMQAHNNQIYAESQEGEWTRFTFELDNVKNK